MSKVGSLEWARRRGGRLTGADRFSIALAAIQLRLRRRFAPNGKHASRGRLQLDALRFPDSVGVKSALALCEAVYEPYLLNHCFRTYLWAGLVGQYEALKVDYEELLIASLFHDLGLTAYAKAQVECDCFAVRGGLAAEKYLRETGQAALVPAVPESICMHLNLSVSAAKPLDYLLHQGAGIDVVGWDLYKVSAFKEDVLSRYPRQAFKARICEALKQEAREHPRARPALMVRLGFLNIIQNAAYDE